MGRVYQGVLFDRQPPSLEEVRAKLEKRIGLPVQFRRTDDTAWFSAEPFSERRILLGNQLNLRDREWGVSFDGLRWGYFMWALLATLEELGGHSDLVLPPFVNTRWKNRKWWQRFSAVPAPSPTAHHDEQPRG